MAASSQVRYYTGASPGVASSDVTGITVRHKQADNSIVDTNNPIPVPQVAGTINFGWRKSSKVNWSTSPLSSISNLRWFLTGVPVTGQAVYARLQSTGIYTQANSGDQSGITGFTDNPTNRAASNAANNYPSSSPLSVNAGTVLNAPSTGEGTQVFVETQMSLDNTFSGGSGPITPLTVTYRYAEA